MTAIVIHSKTDIEKDEEIQTIISSIKIKETTTRNRKRIRKI